MLLVTIDTLRADHVGCLRIPARRHSDARCAGCARRALQDRDRARAADRPVARIDPHRADAARPRVPQQRRIRAGSHHQDGRGGLPEGGLPHGRRRVGLSARSPVRIRSRVRGVRGPPAARERSPPNAVRRASGGRQRPTRRSSGSRRLPADNRRAGSSGCTTTIRMRRTSRRPTSRSASGRRRTTARSRSSIASSAAC